MTSSDLQTLRDIVGADGQRDPTRYAVAGLLPSIALAPSTAEELAEVLRACNADRLGCLVVGGMSRMSSCPALERYDVALVTDRLRVFEHHAADMMCTVGAGMRLSAISERLSYTGQWLPWEAEVSGPTTIGGAIVTNCAGACEDGFGPPRRRVLELLAITGLGDIIRVGAKVTKHSAGYGIHRLLCGSWGSLAVIAEATVTLAPMPGRTRYRVPLADWEEALNREATAERLSPHLVSFVLSADSQSLYAEYDVVGNERTLAWAAAEIGTTTEPTTRGDWDSAIRFVVDRSRVLQLARSLYDAYPQCTILWRPLSGVVWLLSSVCLEDLSQTVALARAWGATWRVERGPTIEPWKCSDDTDKLRERVCHALDPHRVLIGEGLRGSA